MKNVIKILLITIVFSWGISFDGFSVCDTYPSIGDCLACSFKPVAENPGACMGSGVGCPVIIC